jgi:hypothetical protein
MQVYSSNCHISGLLTGTEMLFLNISTIWFLIVFTDRTTLLPLWHQVYIVGYVAGFAQSHLIRFYSTSIVLPLLSPICLCKFTEKLLNFSFQVLSARFLQRTVSNKMVDHWRKLSITLSWKLSHPVSLISWRTALRKVIVLQDGWARNLVK